MLMEWIVGIKVNIDSNSISNLYINLVTRWSIGDKLKAAQSNLFTNDIINLQLA